MRNVYNTDTKSVYNHLCVKMKRKISGMKVKTCPKSYWWYN